MHLHKLSEENETGTGKLQSQGDERVKQDDFGE